MDLAGDFFSALRHMNARDSGPEAAPDPAVHVAERPEIPLSDRVTPAIGLKGIALIKRFEGSARRCRDGKFQAYPDPGTGGAPWTIGWGATGPGIASGTVWSQAECDARLEQDLERNSCAVARALNGAPCSPGQFDALVSFHYNTGAIAKATLTRLHLAGRYSEAAKEFSRWIYASGRRLPGLVGRRAAEAALYCS